MAASLSDALRQAASKQFDATVSKTVNLIADVIDAQTAATANVAAADAKLKQAEADLKAATS